MGDGGIFGSGGILAGPGLRLGSGPASVNKKLEPPNLGTKTLLRDSASTTNACTTGLCLN